MHYFTLMKQLAAFAGIFLMTTLYSTADATREALFEGAFQLKEEMRNVHPRLYTGPAEMEAAARRYQEDPEWCAIYLPEDGGAEMTANPVPLDQGVSAQRNAIIIAKIAVAWRITGEEKYLNRLHDWLPLIAEYEPPEMHSIGGAIGLTSGHVLLGLSIAYDVTKGQGDEELESTLRDAIIRQGQRSFTDLAAMKRYAYEQNHLIIPVCGLGVAAMTVVDEYPEAAQWGVFSGNLMERTLDAIAVDGWFFEGFSYWNYTFQFPAAFAAAQKRTVGGSAFDVNAFSKAPLYLAHMTLPNPEFVFDFGDWGPRVESDGVGFQSGYDWPWHTLPTRVKLVAPSLLLNAHDGPEFLRDYLRHVTPQHAEMVGIYTIDAVFGMLLQLPVPEASMPMQTQYADYPPYHYFPDMEVVHWRDNWRDANATALAFKSGPPAGHHFTELLERYPEWRPSLGHAHPDAGSFLIFAEGVFLANDTGYTGAKESADHNTILVDGIGQHEGGAAWTTFRGKPYSEYNKIHMTDVWTAPRVAASTAIFQAAYKDSLEMTKMHRRLLMLEGRYVVILDQLESNLPHAYQWRLHTDRAAEEISDSRFVMKNYPGKLVIESLVDVEARIAPTIVETDPKPTRSRTQQRGYHLELASPKQNNFEFFTALGIQGKDDEADDFKVNRGPGHRLDMSDGQMTCSVWIVGDDALDGNYSYILRDEGESLMAVGIAGSSLHADDISIVLDRAGQVCLALDESGQWQVETSEGDATKVTITLVGKKSQTIQLKDGQ
ncbi:heparinase II/III domain-containing protein [Cerasicoccus frondis]|uniref:heparinase II/III domain-containing protein n=1 Tax=Cerasicoccus frondis TaxID=490090 RepID=UPI0028524906|nr:heparinase II/III family protein [Cerasicoccus frondis]